MATSFRIEFASNIMLHGRTDLRNLSPSALTLLLNAVAALLWWGERFDRPTALGLALALAATVLLNWG